MRISFMKEGTSVSYDKPQRDSKGRFIKRAPITPATTDPAPAPAPKPNLEPTPEKTGRRGRTKQAPKDVISHGDMLGGTEGSCQKTVAQTAASDGSKKKPVLICIDGMDGAGKSVVTKNLQRIFHEVLGKRVYMLEAPNYETPSGANIRNFLYQGMGSIRDRNVVSLMYAVDRNEVMRKAFDNIFRGPESADVVIANRWAISSLIYQTTCFNQSNPAEVSDVDRGKRIPLYEGRPASWNLPIDPWCLYEFKFLYESGHPFGENTLDSLRLNLTAIIYAAQAPLHMVSKQLGIHPVLAQMVKERCQILGKYLRAYMVHDVASTIYRAEISPWFIPTAHDIYFPFTHMHNVELIGYPSVLLKGVGKRNGDRGFDLYENTNTQLGVLENILYLYEDSWKVWSQQPPMEIRNTIKHMNQFQREGARCFFDISQLPAYPCRDDITFQAFDFTPIRVTDGAPAPVDWNSESPSCGWNNGTRMLAISTVVKDIWTRLGFHREYGAIPGTFHFKL